MDPPRQQDKPEQIVESRGNVTVNLEPSGSLRHTTSKQTARYDETSQYDFISSAVRPSHVQYPIGLSLKWP
jgi:hypothetical protein